jgi:hypothetical protein
MSKQFVVRIENIDYAVFDDGDEGYQTVGALLAKTAEYVRGHGINRARGAIRDENGNTVGSFGWEYLPDPDPESIIEANLMNIQTSKFHGYKGMEFIGPCEWCGHDIHIRPGEAGELGHDVQCPHGGVDI